MEDVSTRPPTCWYVADSTHATPNAQASATNPNIPPKRVQKRHGSLRRRIDIVLRNSSFANEMPSRLHCDELKPKDELLALGGRSFRSLDECTVVAKSEVTRKVNDAIVQFREEQMSERELAALVLRSVRRTAERERARAGKADATGDKPEGHHAGDSDGEKEENKHADKDTYLGEDRDRDFFKRRRTWVEQHALESRKEAARLEQGLDAGTLTGAERVPTDELVFRVLVYLPRSPAFVSEEFLLLGSTPLTALRDAIYCVMDVNVRNVDGMLREEAAMQGNTEAGCGDKSLKDEILRDDRAYFAVNGPSKVVKFYEDRRNRDKKGIDGGERGPRAARGSGSRVSGGKASVDDLSLPIVEHLRDQGQECAVMSMERVSFGELGDISFDKEGRPMLYGHQRCCEHLVKVVDVRIFNPATDAPWKQQYPFRVYAPGHLIEHRRVCEVCSTASASRVTFGDKNTPHSPYYWCDECFGKLHVDAGGNLLYRDFLVYPYEHGYVGL